MRNAPGGPGRTIADVLAAELRRTGCAGLILASPPGPESDLLTSWLPPGLPLLLPDPGGVSDVAGALAAAGAPGSHVEALAWQAVAQVGALSQGLLPVATSNKTFLLLSDAPLAARVMPLGDVWATDVARFRGRATLPDVLRGADEAEVAAAEDALKGYLEHGLPPDAAFAPLGARAKAVRGALDAAEHRRRGLLVPKLEGWTVGIDLAR